MQYAECLKNRCNAVDGTFYDAIKVKRLPENQAAFKNLLTPNNVGSVKLSTNL